MCELDPWHTNGAKLFRGCGDDKLRLSETEYAASLCSMAGTGDGRASWLTDENGNTVQQGAHKGQGNNSHVSEIFQSQEFET